MRKFIKYILILMLLVFPAICHALSLSGSPMFQAFDSVGTPLSGGKLYAYHPGTTTAKSTYQDRDGITAHTNPIILDSRGENEIWWNGSYKLVLKDSDDSLIWTIDNFPGSSSTYGNVFFIDPSNADQGVTGNGATIKAYLDSIGGVTKATLVFPHFGSGVTTAYTVSTALDLSSYLNINFQFENGAQLEAFAGVTFSSSTNIIAQNNQHIFSGVSNPIFNKASLVYPGWNGAKGDGTTDDTLSINKAGLSIPNGGKIKVIPGTYIVSAQSAVSDCVTIPYDNIVLEGDGSSSIIKTLNDYEIPIYITGVSNITVTKLKVQGTGSYAYYGLSRGRGILINGSSTNIAIIDNDVIDMSMIGICTETAGYVRIDGNRVHGCLFTAINYNGMAYQSIIANNIVSGATGGGGNSCLIQATSSCSIIGNTVYNSTGIGIVWGELEGHQVGIISGNVVKNCSGSGILAWYTGPVTITSNTVTNCVPGIHTQGGAAVTVEVTNAIVSNNILYNNSPYQIQTDADYTVISGNQLYTNLTPVQITGVGQPSYIGVQDSQAGIQIDSNYNNIYGNVFATGNYYDIWVVGINRTNYIYNNTTKTGSVNVRFVDPITSYPSVSLPGYNRTIIRAEVPASAGTTSYAVMSIGDIAWRTPVIGQPLGWICTNQVDTAVRVEAASGTTLEVNDTTGILAGDVINIRLSGGGSPGYFFKTTVASVTDGDTLQLTDTLTGDSYVPALVGAGVYTNRWVALANL